MSYKPTPKTSYGDTDFSDDTWSPQGSSSINPPPPPNYAAPPSPPQYPGMGARGLNTVTQPPYGQGQPMDPTQYAGMNPMQRGQTNPIAALASSITQEDILFMRSWQRDSFYYRVIPVEVIGLGSMYMYNKTKSLPHSIPKYLAMATVAFIFGKWTYRNEFKRRLAESPLNTPYMQTMRRSLGIAPSVKSEFSDSSLAYSGGKDEFSDTWSSGAGSSAFQPAPAYTDDRQFGSSGLAPTSYDSPLGSDRLDNQTNVDAAKPQVTYEELRARNRGFMK